jgi:hypothetical protein
MADKIAEENGSVLPRQMASCVVIGPPTPQVIKATSSEHSYYYLYKSAELSLQLFDSGTPKQPLHLASVFVMAAFSVEAYVNELCAKKVSARLWDGIERKLSTGDKIRLLAGQAQAEIDFSKRPFQLLSDIFKARDAFAHAKHSEWSMLRTGLEGVHTLDSTIRGPIETYLHDGSRAANYLNSAFEILKQLHVLFDADSNSSHPLERGARTNNVHVKMVRQEINIKMSKQNE